MEEQEIGYISNFLNKILGRSTDFTETVSSMEIDHVSVDTVKKGDSLGLRVSENTRRKDKVYKVIED